MTNESPSRFTVQLLTHSEGVSVDASGAESQLKPLSEEL